MDANTTFIEWHLKSGATLPLHYHQQEQMNFVRKGELIGIALLIRADFLGGQAGIPDLSTAANKLLRACSK